MLIKRGKRSHFTWSSKPTNLWAVSTAVACEGVKQAASGGGVVCSLK